MYYLEVREILMATFYEFKKMVGKIFGKHTVEENEDDIVISFQNRLGFSQQSNIADFIITNSELRELYDRVNAKLFEKLELFSENSYEIAISLEYPMMGREQYPVVSSDIANGIKYTLGFPSIEYCAFLIMKIIDESNHCWPPFFLRLTRPESLRRYISEGETMSLEVILPQLIRELSLQIETNDAITVEDFRKYKTSFVFQFMYRCNCSCIEFSNINEVFHLNRNYRERIKFEQFDTQPLREYLSDVVDYYKMALSTSDPYIKFISFYHVMEYFYDEVFRKKMITDLRERITNPGFSYKSDDKLYEVALFVKNRLKMNDEAGQGNELESLKFVLNEYVPIDDLKTRISEMDSTAIQYYELNKAGFCNAPTIPWSDMQGIYIQLAKRIYFIRNSLVHSKSSKNQERYKPYRDEIQLQKEIPLVKSVAELIIINSSSII